MSGALLVTGATGFLGMSLVARLLEEDGDGPDVFLLVRDRARVDAMLHALYDEAPAAASRLRPVGGDLTTPGLGLDAAARADLQAAVTHVVHCAASISFTLPLDEARAINTTGTGRVLELAGELPRLERLVHVSTAYVAGRRDARFHEDDRDPSPEFRNTYEQTKWEAEQRVLDGELPAVVVRPSIVVGERDSGWTPAFNVLYWPLQAFARGLVGELPADPEGIVDVVPVDHVVDVVQAATFATGATGAYHAVAADRAPRVADLVPLAAGMLDRPPPPVVAPRPGDDEHPGGVFAPYFDVRCHFDDRRCREQLGLAGPAVEDFFEAVVTYARDTGWGRRGMSRQAARALALEHPPA